MEYSWLDALPVVAGVGGLGIVALFAFASRFLMICKPGEVLILSGRRRKLADGAEVGYRVVFGGRAWRVPLLERAEHMPTRAIPIDVAVQGAYTKVGIALKVRAIAVVKISSNPQVVMNAVERFLGRDPMELQRVAKETLEGNLRGVLATLTPEEVNEDRLKFADSLAQEVEHDLAKLGLHLDVLKIQHVTDDTNYLNSIGRTRIAQVVRDAEIAESNARNEASKEAAATEMSAKVAESEAEQLIAQRRNEVRRVTAELELEAKSLEERSTAAGTTARTVAAQELQSVRRELEALRLMADVVVPAEIAREAAAEDAAGDAASTAADGKASAESLRLVTEAWAKAGTSGSELFLLNQLAPLLRHVVNAVGKVEVRHVQLVDGGDGSALPRFVAAHPAAITEVFRALSATTGIDLMRLLSREATPVTETANPGVRS